VGSDFQTIEHRALFKSSGPETCTFYIMARMMCVWSVSG